MAADRDQVAIIISQIMDDMEVAEVGMGRMARGRAQHGQRQGLFFIGFTTFTGAAKLELWLWTPLWWLTIQLGQLWRSMEQWAS